MDLVPAGAVGLVGARPGLLGRCCCFGRKKLKEGTFRFCPASARRRLLSLLVRKYVRAQFY